MRHTPSFATSIARLINGLISRLINGLIAWLMVASSASLSMAQLTSTVALSNGVEVKVTANLGQPTGAETLTVEMARASGNSFYRTFKDQNHLTVFAYELSVGLSSDGKELHFVGKPVENEFAARYPNADAGKPVPTLSSDHDFMPLESGQDDQIGLFEIPGMGLRVADSVKAILHAPDESAGSGGPLRFASMKVSINGTPSAGPARASVSGRYAMFYIPGQGGFFFATEAPEGRNFMKAGSIDRNRMQFNMDNVSFDCSAADSILVNADSGEIWVFHDPAYQPAGNWTQEIRADQPDVPAKAVFFTAASDSLSWWLP